MVHLTLDDVPVRGSDGRVIVFADEATAHAYAVEHLQGARIAEARGRRNPLALLPTVSIVASPPFP